MPLITHWSTSNKVSGYIMLDGFENDELISAGNFHGEYVAKSADFISMALFSLGRFS